MSESEFAKTHLRDHLMTLLVHPISEGFWSVHASATEVCERNGQSDQVLRTFQNMLTKIPEWTDATLAMEVDRIVKTTKCTYLDDLLMGVFIAYMKSFASLHYRGDSGHVEVDFDRPTMAKFIHEAYIQSARKLWQAAYLFKTNGVVTEQQARNRHAIAGIIQETMEHVIRSFLPWESIARQFSTPTAAVTADRRVVFDQDDSSDDDEESEEDDAPHPRVTISDEVATIEFKEIEDDPLKEITGGELVLNL